MEQIRRTYIYYSGRKILELRQQIPQSRWDKVTKRLSGVEVTVLGSGAKVSVQASEEETILTMLQKVWVDLDDLKKIGTFDEPNEYVYGKLVFKYGAFDMFDPPLFFFVGATDRTIVGLGGSKENLRGFRDREVRVAANAESVIMESEVPGLLYRAEGSTLGQSLDSLATGEEHSANALAIMYENWDWRSRKMAYEVLARVELNSTASPPFVKSPKSVLIGSPIFVAQA